MSSVYKHYINGVGGFSRTCSYHKKTEVQQPYFTSYFSVEDLSRKDIVTVYNYEGSVQTGVSAEREHCIHRGRTFYKTWTYLWSHVWYLTLKCVHPVHPLLRPSHVWK